MYINGEEMSIPDSIEFLGNGTEIEPYIFERLWINNTNGPGIWINGSSAHIIIKDTYVTFGIFNRSDGIFISNSTNVTIAESLVQSCYIGIHLDNSSDIKIIGSDLSGNRYGALFRNSPRNELTDCSMNGNTIDGVLIEDSEESIVSFCEMRANSARIANDAAIRIIRSSGSIVQGCMIQMNYGTGIFLQGPMMDCIVIDCDINYNNVAMMIRSNDRLRVHGMELVVNMKGVELQDLENSTFTDISGFRNGEGILMEGVIGSIFRSIDLKECGFGLDLRSSHTNLINNITITGSRSYDLMVGDPMYPSYSSDNNKIYGNYFQKDNDHLPSVHDHGSGNTWHFNGSGNTWSGWDWEDLDEDGIGDNPFEINGTAGSRDMYPRSDIILISDDTSDEGDPIADPDVSTNLLIILIASFVTITLLITIALIMGRKTGNE
jgi:parallel beta-helix repeat protein